MVEQKSTLKSTLKSADTEETLDLIFYRPVGYLIALFSKKVGLTPNPITIISIFWGILAGHMFYYHDLTLNIIGIISLVFANLLDSADGQLARMTNNCTKLGRFLDGFAGNLWFVSIYVHLMLRLINEGYSPAIFLFMIMVGAFHSLQAAMADYYRTQHLIFIGKNSLKDIEDLKQLKEDYKSLSWKSDFFRKLYLRMFINYVSQQQFIARKYGIFRDFVVGKYGDNIPAYMRERYRELSKPLMKYTNILTTNTRMITLFISVLLGNVWIYLWFELTVLNLLLIYMVLRHESMSRKLIWEFAE